MSANVQDNASNIGVGAVLSQVQGGQENVIENYSKVLSKPETTVLQKRTFGYREISLPFSQVPL